MTKFVVTRSARADLLDIRRFLSAESVEASRRVGSAFEAAFAKLAASPNLGHARPDLAPEPYRFYLVFSWLVVYRAEGDVLRVVRVLHAARDIRAMFH